MKRDSFVFYKSFYDSIKELDPKDQVQIYDAIFEYQFEGNEKDLKGVCKSIFTLIIPQLEANNKRYINGCKGGAPKGNQNATKKQPKTTEIQPNDNVNDNVNDNDIRKENIKRKEFKKPTLEEVQEYCKERNNNIDPHHFIDFYESKGWKVGNQSMKDWKACIRTWEKRETTGKAKKPVPSWWNQEIEENTATPEEIAELERKLKER